MPINFRIKYADTSLPHTTGQYTTTIALRFIAHFAVEDDTGANVDWVEFEYTPASGGSHSTTAVQLAITDWLVDPEDSSVTGPFKLLPVVRTVSPASPASSCDITVNYDRSTMLYTLIFSAPNNDDQEVVYQFDDGSVPPVKLKVKVKRLPPVG